MDENWVRYGLAKLGQISRLPNWQRMLFCAYTTQLLHSTGEVCWNSIPPNAHGWLSCGSPIRVSTTFNLRVGVNIVRNDMYSERCVNLVFLFWGEVGKFRLSRVVPRERVGSPKSESRRVKLLRDGCACGARETWHA